MHSAIIAIIAAASGLSHAAVIKRTSRPATTQCSGAGAFYLCAANGFEGNCSVDPCAMEWCPDFEKLTCKPAEAKGTGTCTSTTTVVAKPIPTCAVGAGAYYVCANGFRGCCTSDPCSNPDGRCEKPACPQGKCSTTVIVTVTTTPAATATAYPAYTDADVTSTAAPTSSAAPEPAKRWAAQMECPGKGAYYVCGNNNFRGYCSVDPCAIKWCPDFEAATCDRKTPAKADPAEKIDPVEKIDTPVPTGYSGVTLYAGEVCAAPKQDSTCYQGTGYFQNCAENVRVCSNIDFCGRRKASGL